MMKSSYRSYFNNIFNSFNICLASGCREGEKVANKAFEISGSRKTLTKSLNIHGIIEEP